MKSFLDVERAQTAQLASLKAGDADTAMLSRLVEMSCLLELSKLSTARLDLAGYAQACVTVLQQFVPVVSCALRIAVRDLPEVRVTSGGDDGFDLIDGFDECGGFGDFSDGGQGGAGGDGPCSFPLMLDGEPAGRLRTTPVPAVFGGGDMFAKAAEHISAALPLVVESELRRREAAVGRALELAATLPDHYAEDELEELAATMASLPSAVGCAIRLDAGDSSTPMAARAGATAGGEATIRSLRLDDRLELEVSVWWGAEPHGEEDGFERVLDVLVASLDRIERNRRLLTEAETDALTGVGNRRRASRALAGALTRAERHGEQLSLLLFDLDNFKLVNDSLGHGVGDDVLVAFASLLASAMRTYDSVARVGGEEFVVICPELDSVGAVAVARRLLSATPAACERALPDGWSQTVSVGVATFPDAATSADRLMRRADDALYTAKRAGRNQFAVAGHERPTRHR